MIQSGTSQKSKITCSQFLLSTLVNQANCYQFLFVLGFNYKSEKKLVPLGETKVFSFKHKCVVTDGATYIMSGFEKAIPCDAQNRV